MVGKPDILLVHGSFHTEECWEFFVPELADRGLTPHPVTLGGHRGNPRNALSVTMRSYGSDVIRLAEHIGRPVILLGHSMGGFVISEAAQRRPDLFPAMIYLAAFVPRCGRSSLARMPSTSKELQAAARPRINGTVVIDPTAAKDVFYNHCAPEIQDRAATQLCPQPLRPPLSPVTVSEGRLGAVPKHYIETTDDRALPIASQRAMQAHAKFESIETMDTDHSPFYSAPGALADLVARMCQRTAA